MARFLAERLVASRDEPSFAAFTQGLDGEERQGLLAELAARRLDGAAAALLRAMLGSPSLRLLAAREGLRLMHADVLTGKPAVLCLSELRIAVLRY